MSIGNRQSKIVNGDTFCARKAFSLVELLVAMALTIFIMAILSEAFVKGIHTFRQLKAVSALDQQLRTAYTIIRRDLKSAHFEGDRRLRDFGEGPNFVPPEHGFFSIREGAGYSKAPATASSSTYYEGTDSARPSERDYFEVNGSLFNFGDSLHFTSRLDGNKREDFFYGRVPAGFGLDNIGFPESRFDSFGDGRYSSQWGETIIFLRPMKGPGADGVYGTADDPPPETTGTLPLFNLCRLSLPLVPEQFATGTTMTPAPDRAYLDNTTTNAVTAKNAGGGDIPGPGSSGARINDQDDAPTPGKYSYGEFYAAYSKDYEVSGFARPETAGPYANRYTFAFNSPADVQYRERRYNIGQPHYPSAQSGADILVTNVISFDVKVWDPSANGGLGEFVDLGGGSVSRFGDNGSYKNDPPKSQLWRVYDTWSSRNGEFNYSNQTKSPGLDGIPGTLDDDTRGADNTYFTADDPRPVPYPFPIKATQIKIRVWDRKTEQSREITIVQDM